MLRQIALLGRRVGVTAVDWWSRRIAIVVVRRQRRGVVLGSRAVSVVPGAGSGPVVGRAGGRDIVRRGHVDRRGLRVGGGQAAGTLASHQQDSLQYAQIFSHNGSSAGFSSILVFSRLLICYFAGN